MLNKIIKIFYEKLIHFVARRNRNNLIILHSLYDSLLFIEWEKKEKTNIPRGNKLYLYITCK